MVVKFNQNFEAPSAAATSGMSQPATSGGGAAGQPRQKVRARRGQATDPHSIAERVSLLYDNFFHISLVLEIDFLACFVILYLFCLFVVVERIFGTDFLCSIFGENEMWAVEEREDCGENEGITGACTQR